MQYTALGAGMLFARAAAIGSPCVIVSWCSPGYLGAEGTQELGSAIVSYTAQAV